MSVYWVTKRILRWVTPNPVFTRAGEDSVIQSTVCLPFARSAWKKTTGNQAVFHRAWPFLSTVVPKAGAECVKDSNKHNGDGHFESAYAECIKDSKKHNGDSNWWTFWKRLCRIECVKDSKKHNGDSNWWTFWKRLCRVRKRLRET